MTRNVKFLIILLGFVFGSVLGYVTGYESAKQDVQEEYFWKIFNGERFDECFWNGQTSYIDMTIYCRVE